MVKAYIRQKRAKVKRELDRFRALPTDAAIQRAALALDKGKRFSHQRRLKRNALRKSEEILSESVNVLRACINFDDLPRISQRPTP
jgi:hypothetical protein